MKAQLNFDLDDFDDRIAHERCSKALDMALVLWELQYNTRKSLTNGYDEDDGFHRGVEAVLERLSDSLHEHNVNIDKLVI